MAYVPPPAARAPGAPEPSAAAAAGAAAAALLQRQLAEDVPKSDKPNAGWSEHQTGDGRKFFFNEDTQTSTWEKPDVLMTPEERKNDTNWHEYRIWDGRVFYHNSETKVSCWSMPPEIRRLRGESSGIDETPLPQTSAERRRAFWDHLREMGADDSWSWAAVEEATAKDAQAQDLSVEIKKQVFGELVGLCLRAKQLEAREKQRNAAKALERLIEERFGNPEDLATSYEEAASLLEHEEAWQLIKSDVRRDEVFQTVMERLEEKHQKTRTEKRAEQAVRLQRLIATDSELKRPRLRWKDAAAILAKRDELWEEDPPLEALRVWASLRDLKPASEHEQEAKMRNRSIPDEIHRAERKRRDTFVDVLRDMLKQETFTKDTPWSDLEGQFKANPAYLALREGPGATAGELFDEFQEELGRGVAPEKAGVGFEIDLAAPPPPPAAQAALDQNMGVKSEVRPPGSVKHEEPAAKRARFDQGMVKTERAVPGVRPPAPMQPGLLQTKTEAAAKAPQPSSLLVAKTETPQPSGLLAAKTETPESSPLDQLLAAADAMKATPGSGEAEKQAVSTPLTKEELLDPVARVQTAQMAKEEMGDAGGSDPLAVPAVPAAKRVMAPKKAAAPPAGADAEEPPPAAEAEAAVEKPTETFTAVQLMAKKVDELRELCRTRGLPVSGKKQELVDRLATP